MKSLWVAIIAVMLLGSIVVAGELYTRSTNEVVTFAQLPASFQQIPVYPNAQGFWHGTAQEEISWQAIGTRIITFTTSDPTDKVMDFYRTTLESSGWSYDTSGHVDGACVPFTYFEGDFYVNDQRDLVWVAVKHTDANMEYQIFKVGGTFFAYNECGFGTTEPGIHLRLLGDGA
jgi:hypothetical protein